jgi:ADP-ribose pyrophosphatase
VSGVRPDASFQLLHREYSFRGRFVSVSIDHIRLPGGHETRHETLHLPSAVCVVPLLEARPGSVEVVLIEQLRSSVQGFIHELPAGILEPGEDPAACAARELEEETGYVADRISHLVTLLPIPGTSDHRMHFYLAEGLRAGEQRLEAAECLTVKRVPLDHVLEALLGKREPLIVDAKTHVGLLHVALRRTRR